jgi:hypothetical protein
VTRTSFETQLRCLQIDQGVFQPFAGRRTAEPQQTRTRGRPRQRKPRKHLENRAGSIRAPRRDRSSSRCGISLVCTRNDDERVKKCLKQTAMYLNRFYSVMGALSDLIVLALVVAILVVAFIIFLRLLPWLILAALVLVLIWFLFFRNGPRSSVAPSQSS